MTKLLDGGTIGVKELAEFFGVTELTVRRLADSGKIPWGMRIGHSRRWLRSEIEAFLLSQSAKGGGR